MLSGRVASLAVVALGLCACVAPDPSKWFHESEHLLRQQSFAVAVYDNKSRLVNLPINRIREDFRSAARDGKHYTDLYVLIHGWNFEVPEAFGNYVSWARQFDTRFKQLGASSPEVRSTNPYVLFVVWDSISRPLGDIAASVLPLGLDDPVSLVLKPVDAFVFHIPSVWGESMKAATVALGRGPAGEYRALTYDDLVLGDPPKRPPAGPPASVPVSVLLRGLIDLRAQYADRARPLRIHVVGHSYGGKIATLATTEALVAERSRGTRFADDDFPIESLVTFDAAMHATEMYYDLDLTEEQSDASVWSALQHVRRKALVFTNYDSPNAHAFDLSELLLSKAIMQRSHQRRTSYARGTSEFIGASDPAAEVFDALYSIGEFAVVLVRSVGDWTLRKLVYLPSDFTHHVAHNPWTSDEERVWWEYALNTLHFFAPLDYVIASGQPADAGGILRTVRPAVGYSGLAGVEAGRPDLLWFSQTGALGQFLDPASTLDGEGFVREADGRRAVGKDAWDPRRIYTFDASHVFDSKVFDPWWNPLAWDMDAAHGDMRDEGLVTEANVAGSPLFKSPKRDFTLGFIWTVTQPDLPPIVPPRKPKPPAPR